ncbi:MAG TPA: biopolymer transporter ExbD [Verrucomicrobiae bacterium]|nr:biopolymer transporter ExbD [Verrucomicrobiae bacterium]
MKFPRNSKILRSQFDVAPFAAVFFIIVIFIMLGALMPVPGLQVQLNPPAADNLPGINGRTIAMAVDSVGRTYIENRMVDERQLKNSLRVAVDSTHQPLTLVIHADRAVTYEQLTHLSLLAREKPIGITNILLATLPRVTDAPIPR